MSIVTVIFNRSDDLHCLTIPCRSGLGSRKSGTLAFSTVLHIQDGVHISDPVACCRRCQRANYSLEDEALSLCLSHHIVCILLV